MQRLFVYGTLAPGRSNHHIVEGILGTWEDATLKGYLIDEGWGAQVGYPGIVPSDAGDSVQGFVFSSHHLHENWTMLDEFEGEEYVRTPVTVTTSTGERLDAFVYAVRSPNL